MVPFDPDAGPRLFDGGPVVLFHRRAVLDAAVAWLTAHGYAVHRLDARWSSRADFHTAVARALDFPAHYGRNLDAFADCLRDLATPRTALVFDGYDTFARHDPAAAHAVLDIIAGQAGTGRPQGDRLRCLVRVDDPDVPLGAVAQRQS